MATVKCFCDHEAYHGTVKKDGTSKGKRFFRCPKWPHGNCSFFKWDESWANTAAPLTTAVVPEKTPIAISTEIAALTKRIELLENKLKQAATLLQ
jgi:hypothetical protein